MNYLKNLQEFVDEMKSTSSLNEKKQIIESIKDNQFITKVLYYTYNPYFKYYVTSKNCKKNSDLIDMNFMNESIFELLDDLKDRTYTGHDAIAMVNGFVLAHKEYTDLIFSILDRNLEIRANDSVINKIIPGLIPTFDVALATKYEPRFCDFEDEPYQWLVSRKLDGVRCIIRKEGDEIKAYSRQGNEFTTLQNVLDDVREIAPHVTWHEDFILDGEICLMDEDGNEDFQGVMKQIKRKDHTIVNPKYIIFDCLSLDEFDSKEGYIKLSERLERLDDVNKGDGTVESDLVIGVDTLEILPQFRLNDEEDLMRHIDIAEQSGHEGVMLRKDVGYEGKRSKNLLKCKKFFDAEYVVRSMDSKNHRIIRDGKEVVMPMLAQVYIMHKGCSVAVGSGFNQEQRIRYEANPADIIGKTITVQYFEETQNQDGGFSLRFPTVKHIYQNGRQC